jgi:hypothetical protein
MTGDRQTPVRPGRASLSSAARSRRLTGLAALIPHVVTTHARAARKAACARLVFITPARIKNARGIGSSAVPALEHGRAVCARGIGR